MNLDLNVRMSLLLFKRVIGGNGENESHKNLYERFAKHLTKAAFTPIFRSSLSNDYLIEFPHALPRPHHCPNEKSCLGGLDSLCAVGCEGSLVRSLQCWIL